MEKQVTNLLFSVKVTDVVHFSGWMLTPLFAT
jgi:hypothetical protein